MAHTESHKSHAQQYLVVLLCLLVLTVITVWIAQYDFGAMNLIVAMIVASIKAGLVALIFMHLKHENPLLWLYVFIPLVLVGLLLGGVFIDEPFRTKGQVVDEHYVSESTTAGHH
jgi:cytochrome c oxidase subunit IV